MKSKKLTLTIPPPLGDGSCDAGCPLYRVAAVTLPPRFMRLCGAGLGRVGYDHLLFPSEGCPQKEAKRCHG